MRRVSNVNTTDIADAVRLGCRTMGSVFNADDGDIPFFRSTVWPSAEFGFNDSHSESHVPGRHLNALLTAEDVIGVEVPDDVVEKHARAAYFSYGGAVPLPLNRDAIGGRLIRFLPHNIREGFHALYALVRYRGSERARQLAEASIAAIDRLWDPVVGWDRAEVEGSRGLQLVEWKGPFISGIARAIGPLAKYHRATGYEPALDLAVRLKDKAVAEFFTPEGAFDRATFGTHTHSVTCVLSSLAQLADLTDDARLLRLVRAFFDNGLNEISDEIGWSIENCADEANPDRGEANNTGDILETALILGRRVDPAYFHRAERILRGHLLPSQLRDVSFVVDPPNAVGLDARRDVADRHLGAFGFPAPYGHAPLGAPDISFNMDIVGGAVGSLCEAHREAVRSDDSGHWVNLLFDRETDAVRVASPYTRDTLVVTVKQPGALRVRIPPWVDRGTMGVVGPDDGVAFEGGYLVVARPPIERPVVVSFPLTGGELTLAHRTRGIRTRLLGDRVVAMDNFGADMAFFDPI